MVISTRKTRRNYLASGLKHLLYVFIFICLSEAALGQEVIRFGVFPFLPPNRLETNFGPLTKKLENFFGKPVVFRTRKSFPEFLRALRDESFDIALVQPFDYVQIRDTVAYQPLVRRVESLHAVVVVKEEGIRKLDDLRGKVIAFPPSQAAATILGRQYLAANGIIANEFVLKSYPEHDSCIQAVLTDSAQACVTSKGIIENQFRLRDLPLRVIGESPPIPHVLFVLHPNLMNYQHDLTELLVNLKNSESGKKILTQSLMIELTEAKAAEYDIVYEIFRSLNHTGN